VKHSVSIESTDLDVIVVGGGHAGIEASLAAARMGCKTLLITMDRNSIGRMSCNPAIGGTAKGHLVREIDALGGEMAKIADTTGIQFRMLNKSKGPAVWSPRSQNDRDWYAREALRRIENEPCVHILEDSIKDIKTSQNRQRGPIHFEGVVTTSGIQLKSKTMVLSAGTFLRAIMHTGLSNRSGGRIGEGSCNELTQNLEKLGLVTGRLKTGTPPRINIRSVLLKKMEEQASDSPPCPFSFQSADIKNRTIPMYLTYTNSKTHNALIQGFDRSPMLTGRIKGRGPRYCPSIEDKIVRFAERERHQIFIEPEGYNTHVAYVNGFSTSLPAEIQAIGLRTISGFENVEILRPGYAVEYDFFPPHQLKPSFETKVVEGLFLAGQICGTSGYEEAASQGLIAGINAALKVKRKDPFVLRRSEAYIGVLLDDLINKGTDEPYRMFTSHAEYRLLLRQDNADRRLMRYGNTLGLIPSNVYAMLGQRERLIQRGIEFVENQLVGPPEISSYLESKNTSTITQREKLAQILRRPEVSLQELIQIESIRSSEFVSSLLNLGEQNLIKTTIEQIEIEIKYGGYFRQQQHEVEQFERFENYSIPEDYNFERIRALSTEAKEKLKTIQPISIGQASRISGVTPADISVLMIHLKR